MSFRRDASMIWVIGATLLVWFLALLPLIYDIAGLHSQRLNELWGLAPNQFVFLLVPFPVAAFTAFLGLRYVLTKLSTEKINDPILDWLVANWPVAILVGCILVSIITIADFFYTAKVFDRLEPPYAVKAVDSAEILRRRVESSLNAEEIENIRRRTATEGKTEADLLRAGPVLPETDILALAPSTYMNIVLDAYFQRHWRLLNPTAHALSVLQLFAVLITGLIAVFSVLIVYLAVKAGHRSSVGETVNALAFCVVAFAVYPVCYRYFVAEMQLITNFTSTIRGDVMSAFLILACAGLVLTLDPERREFSSVINRSLPFLLVIGPSVYSAIAGPLALRSVIGIDANPGGRATLLVIMLVLAAFIILTVWPRDKAAAVNPPIGPEQTK